MNQFCMHHKYLCNCDVVLIAMLPIRYHNFLKFYFCLFYLINCFRDAQFADTCSPLLNHLIFWKLKIYALNMLNDSDVCFHALFACFLPSFLAYSITEDYCFNKIIINNLFEQLIEHIIHIAHLFSSNNWFNIFHSVSNIKDFMFFPHNTKKLFSMCQKLLHFRFKMFQCGWCGNRIECINTNALYFCWEKSFK